MKILVALNHPAHYYLFKYTVINLKSIGHTVKYVIKDKDILEKLLISESVEYIKINEKRRRKRTVFSVIYNGLFEMIKQDFNLFKLLVKWHPDIMVGTDFSITHIGRIKRIPSYVFNEDDYEINRLFCKLAYPFATGIVSPNCCSVGKYRAKKIEYNGYQKMAYLNPKYFVPDRSVISDIVGNSGQYFIIRLVTLNSGHDIEGKHSGLTGALIDQILEILDPLGKVYISSEGKLDEKYERYRLRISPNKIHHLLAFASLFIGDSQTMCIESGLLGTPFVRYNDYVGKIECLNEIENKYHLGFGIQTNRPEMVLTKIREILHIENIKEEWQRRKEIVFQEKVDPTIFYTNCINQILSNH